MTEAQSIRNFSIVAHIDHGKSTLADRLLEITGALTKREMAEQVLDSMDLERERGITIKAQTVALDYKANDGQLYRLNLIDTPGHVDFSYEVSRSLAACEGALLVVDAAQGVEAQTVANTYLAVENGLELIPVINKVDLPGAEPERVAGEIADLTGGDPGEVLRISAKTGEGVRELLNAIVEQVPPPTGDAEAPARALIFDSSYDQYRGVVAFVRVVDGSFTRRQALATMATDTRFEAEELGFFTLLLTVNGVGPKVALAIVGSRPTPDLQLAIMAQDQAVLVAIPGIGRKLAERVIFELKEKVAAAGVADGKSLHEKDMLEFARRLLDGGFGKAGIPLPVDVAVAPSLDAGVRGPVKAGGGDGAADA